MRYPVTTSWPVSRLESKSSRMLGSATLTIEVSRIDMKEPTVVTMSGSQRGSKREGLSEAGAVIEK
jgi:hypothetical protein